LLAERQFDDCWFLSIPEQGEHVVEKSDWEAASVRMGKRSCSKRRPWTSLKLGIDRVYHPRTEKMGSAEESNEIKPDGYW